MSEEKELIFRRFPKEKQDQVRGLVEYATLMGLSGKDLVSIGGKLDRIKEAQERERNLSIAQGFECLPVQARSKAAKLLDEKLPKATVEQLLDKKFKLKTVGGTYTFSVNNNGAWSIRSSTTKATRSHRPSYWDYDLGKNIKSERKIRYGVLLDIANGKLNLNF